ncbi:MAG: hypothetical protein DRI65_14415 [Chloroflexota bacterium]|nr:MAG: hypothetical protein DRI65_14415 [Chloroflexota bacterium]
MNIANQKNKFFQMLLVVAISMGWSASSQAHHPEIVASADCDTGSGFVINYTATSWQTDGEPGSGNPKIKIFFNGVVVGSGAFVAPDYSFSGSAPAPAGLVGGDLVRVKAKAVAKWDNDNPGGQKRVDRIHLPDEECNPPDPECSIGIEKGCRVVPEPQPFVCKDAKPINALSMTWDGDETVGIKAWKGPVNSTLLAEIDNIVPGQTVTVSGYAGSPNDVIWEIFDADDNKIGESTYHISCSDQGMNGPEDCETKQGDGRDKAGFLNDWLLDGLAGTKAALDCSPESLPDSPSVSSCEIVSPPTPHCNGKVKVLSLRYVGGSCDDTTNTQEGKLKCEDYGSLEDSVTVIATDKKGDKTFFNGDNISIGNIVDVEAANANKKELEAETLLQIYAASGGLLQSLTIHTSCSKALNIGDRLGGFEVVSLDTTNGGLVQIGADVEYQYVIENTGLVTISNVTVMDDKLGAIPGSPIATMLPGAIVELGATAFIDSDTTNTAEATGHVGGGSCSASDEATVKLVPPPESTLCTTKVKATTLKYIGSGDIQNATVEIVADKFKSQPVVYTGIDLVSGTTILSSAEQNGYSIDATAQGMVELGAKVKIRINGVEEVIHTSCSVDYESGFPAPLDKPKGFPSSTWFVEDFTQK